MGGGARTLNHYYTNMAKSNKRNRVENELEEELADLNIQSEQQNVVSNSWPHFLVIQSNDENRPVTALSPFVIDKTIKACAGTVKGVKKLRSGMILVEVDNKRHSESFLKLKKVLDIDVTVTPHRTLNTCKGIVRSYDLAHTSKSEMLLELVSQGVTDVQNIEITKDGQKKRTNTMILTFGLSAVPRDITAGYMKVPVQTYYPSPLRCFN